MTQMADALAPPRGVAIGIDIGGTNVRAARIDRAGTVSGLVKVRTGSAPSVPDLVEGLVHQLLDDNVIAIGIGIPGRLDRDRGAVLSAGFVDLAGVRLGEMLSERVGRPVVMDNDAHMALVAELAVGVAGEAEDVVLFTVGTGIGGAIAVARQVLRGRGNAGQLGHLAIDPSGPPCKCGRRGCSEVFLSGTALNGYVADAGLPPGTTVEHLLAARDEGPAAAVLARWVTPWRHAIDTVVAMLDPDLVVLGGGLGIAAVAALEGSASDSSWFDCPVAAAACGDDAGVIGAGILALTA